MRIETNTTNMNVINHINEINLLPQNDLNNFKKKNLIYNYLKIASENPTYNKKQIAAKIGLSVDTINRYAKSLGLNELVNKRTKQSEIKQQQQLKKPQLKARTKATKEELEKLEKL